jgi:acetyl esterase/lipase
LTSKYIYVFLAFITAFSCAIQTKETATEGPLIIDRKGVSAATQKHNMARSTQDNPPSNPANSPKYSSFHIKDITYKSVHNTPIPASILYPKDLSKPGIYPLAIHFHGGGFITGHRLFPDWYPSWMLDFYLKHLDIVITADHRLMPEGKGVDILDDMKDLWAWVLRPGNIAAKLPEGVEVDLENVLVSGESAGGYLAWQSGRLFPDVTKAVIAHYPMLDLKSEHFTRDYEKALFEPPIPKVPREVLDGYIKTMDKGKVVTSALPPERLGLMVGMVQQGRLEELLGSDDELYPMELLENEEGLVQRLPPMWILHGKSDGLVPVQGTEKYVGLVKEKGLDEGKLHVSLIEGGGHGFDNEPSVTLEKEWVRDGVEFVERFWPPRRT